jgi:hypothetical protein
MSKARQPAVAQPGPIVTLTTDFGITDSYVAEMKAVLLAQCPAARVVDVTHLIGPQDVLAASVTLERVLRIFPKGTIHIAVVDPGVGTERKLLLVAIKGQHVFCPDNGLITWSWRMHGGGQVWEITWRPRKSSATFHGRDIMAPVAARIAAGAELDDVARPIADPTMLDLEPVKEAQSCARIIHIDHFGNATTNMPHAVLREMPAVTVKVRNKTIGKLRRTYWDVPPGRPLALIGCLRQQPPGAQRPPHRWFDTARRGLWRDT